MAKNMNHELVVTVNRMQESNGNIWFSVMLLKTAEQSIFDGYEVYQDKIRGRAEYEAAKLKHFLGQADMPCILDFDTDAPLGLTDGK